MFKSIKGVAVAAATLSLASIVGAQETGDSASGASRVLEEVIVTAQRREESLQDAAIAIDAVQAEDLIRGGIESAADLGSLSPSLGISNAGGPLSSIFVRGVGSLSVNPLLDTAVAQNYDGVYLARSNAAPGQTLFDVERVELLKGPQGTLYGRNATGGVLNYIPQKPVLGDQSGYVNVDFGNYDKVGFQGAANISMGETVAARLAVNYLDRDGYSDDGTNDADTYGIRGQLLFAPTENLSIRLAVDYTDVGGVGSGGDLLGAYNNVAFAGPLTAFRPSGLPEDSGPTSDGANAIRTSILAAPSFSFYGAVDSDDLFQEFTWTGVLAELTYETDAGTLTILPAYRESDQEYSFYGPSFGPAVTQELQEQTTIEARFATDLDGAFNGVFGAFYFDESVRFKANFNQDFVAPIQNYDPEGDSWAVFAQGTLDVTESFRLNAGVRYTEDSKSVVSHADRTYILFCGGPGPFLITPPASFAAGCPRHPPLPATYDPDEFIDTLIATGQIPPGSTPNDGFYPIISGVPGAIIDAGNVDIPDAKLSYGETTYRVGIEWDFAENSLFYAGFEHGYRAGGVDVSAVAPTYDPEFIDAFTVGAKNRFLDNTLQLNVEAFYWEYMDQQVSYFAQLNGGPAFLIANAESTIQGIDVDILWAASDNTTIGAKVQYLDSTFDEMILTSDPNGGRFGCPSQGVGANGFETFDCAGIGLLYAPEFAFDLSLEHIFDLGRFAVIANVDVSHRGEQETDFSLLPETTADDYVTVNLAVTVSPEDASWNLTFYSRNVGDERYLLNTALVSYGILAARRNAPRTYGVRLGLDF